MKYRVKALSVGGKGNKIFKSGDIVSEANFPEGNCPELVKQGFLEPLNGKEADKKAAEKPKKPLTKKEKEALVKREAEEKAKAEAEAKQKAEDEEFALLEKEEADKKSAEEAEKNKG